MSKEQHELRFFGDGHGVKYKKKDMVMVCSGCVGVTKRQFPHAGQRKARDYWTGQRTPEEGPFKDSNMLPF